MQLLGRAAAPIAREEAAALAAGSGGDGVPVDQQRLLAALCEVVSKRGAVQPGARDHDRKVVVCGRCGHDDVERPKRLARHRRARQQRERDDLGGRHRRQMRPPWTLVTSRLDDPMACRSIENTEEKEFCVAEFHHKSLSHTHDSQPCYEKKIRPMALSVRWSVRG